MPGSIFFSTAASLRLGVKAGLLLLLPRYRRIVCRERKDRFIVKCTSLPKLFGREHILLLLLLILATPTKRKIGTGAERFAFRLSLFFYVA